LGSSSYRDELRARIFHVTGDVDTQINYLKNRILTNPGNQGNYLNLIGVYRQTGQTQEAFATVEDFREKFPNSNKIHLVLYPLYFDQKENDKAIASIRTILSDREMDEKGKVMALNAFIAFAKENPEYEDELAEVVNKAIETEKSTKSNKELGDFYSEKEPAKALGFYVKALEEDFGNVQLIESTLKLQLELQKYEEAIMLGKKALTVFPSRPGLYLALGTAYNHAGNPSKALENLEMGLVYLIDNPKMEVGFYEQMSIAYEKSGNPEKTASYKKKAADLKNKNE
jgi:tetratricopeptide (TPR) repeat protein